MSKFVADIEIETDIKDTNGKTLVLSSNLENELLTALKSDVAENISTLCRMSCVDDGVFSVSVVISKDDEYFDSDGGEYHYNKKGRSYFVW